MQKIRPCWWCHLKIQFIPVITRQYVNENKTIPIYSLETWPSLIITCWCFYKNKEVLLMSLENLAWPYYRELKFLQKYKSSFVEVIWKSALPLLSRAEIFAKKSSFLDMIWKLKLPLLSRTEIFSEIKQFCRCTLKIRNAPIIAEAEIFSKIKQFCRSDLTISSYLNILAAMIPRGKIFSKIRFFVNMTWKFDLSLLSRAEIFAKVRQFSWSKFKHWIAPIITS